MESFVVMGGCKLEGTIRVSGAKNAILPIIAAALLSDGECTLYEVPQLRDVQIACAVLEYLGASIEKEDNGETLKIKAENFVDVEAPYELVRKMRASVLVMGPLLAKKGRARISLPGGCAIGSRPIDLHLKGFEALGAKVNVGHGYVEATAEKLVGNKVYLDFPSVGATENILMAACLAEGTTIIENVAEEPEIVDLANFLNSMGAKIRGAGTNIIKVEGVKSLKGAVHTVIPDRIEAGTYMVAAAITKGNVLIENVIIDHLKPVVAKLKEAGVAVVEEGDGVRVFVEGNLKAVDIKTLPYPGFPTDMQAQMGALLSVAAGTSVITESVFENRFMYVDELKRMGANIKLEGRCAIIKGVETLSSAPVKATDLRAGAAMLLAALIANGETEIRNAVYIDRGYEKIEDKLNKIGAKIRRVSL